MKHLTRVFVVTVLFGGVVLGQATTGTPPFASLSGGPFDSVNLGNLDTHFSIPLLNKAGRGMPFNYALTYDNSIWYPVGVSGSQSWQPIGSWGWAGSVVSQGYLKNRVTITNNTCTGHGKSNTHTIYWTYFDGIGTAHAYTSTSAYTLNCDGTYTYYSMLQTAPDGSGFTLAVTSNGSGGWTQTVTDRTGRVSTPPVNSQFGVAVVTDANGNQITVNSSGQYFDTLSSTSPALTVAGSGTPSSPMTYTYTGPGGTQYHYTVTYQSFNVKTNFVCSGITDYPATAANLPVSITLPDQSQYQFTYEDTPNNSGYKTGRISEVTLPGGGTISYSYTYAGTHDGINCVDGSTAELQRTVNPGGVWQFARSGAGSAWTTTVTDPANNQTAISFEEYLSNFYETQRLSYQGSTSGNLLSTSINCYNGQSVSTPANCYNTPITAQVTRVTNFRYIPNSSGVRAETDSTYDSFGLIHEVDEYDYGVGAVGSLIRKTITSYAGGLGNGIVDRPSSVKIEDSGNNVKANTSYNYDETTPTPTTGTPQHISITGSRGLLTSVVAQANGSTNLYRKYTYYDTGNLSTSTDVSTSSTTNGATTTYNYASGTASCGNSFVTSISEPLSLSRSMTWDCNGGVMLSLQDENGKTSSTAYSGTNYTNYFWRPYSTTDQAGTVTDYWYGLNASNQPFQTEGKYHTAFNGGNSTVDILTTTDGFGRTIFHQTKQGPSASNYDTVATCYDSSGRVSLTTLPYSHAAITATTTACPSNPGTSYSYDALNRTASVSDSGLGSTAYTYYENDVLQVLTSPTQQKQLEYDALGRLKSACEITAGTTAFPGGACAQNSSPQPTGYWTTYTYDVLGNLTGVTQNAQASSGHQTRSFVYDMLGRLTQETNPEMNNSAAAYAYDKLTSDSSCGSPNFAGNMVKRVDAAGNATCFSGYDALHRVGTITYPSTSTPTKNFVYDSAIVNGTSMANAKTRLARAYTCSGTCTSNITDLFFSYWPTGQTTDVWELTPHSGTNNYYHVTASPWPNGVMNTLQNLSGLPTITYSADGEGRLGTASAGSGQNPLTSISYDAASHVTALTYGSSDSDSFQFDPNTGRMSQYQFSVGTSSTTDTGALTWNPNGTLQKLIITDNVNPANSQTCNYTHDDLGRVASSNCGTSIWDQNFSYDPFGNIVKTVPNGATGTSFNVNYDYTNNTNRVTTTPYSYTNTSDPNAKTGNMTADTNHAYSWDTDGHLISIDAGSSSGVCLTYDALGRAVEKGTGSSCVTSPTTSTEIVYSPSGAKLALMNGSSLVKAFVPLPGGAQAVYNASGLQYYRHPDWLGSSRFASTTSRTTYYDVAYAPYGEPYAATGTQDLSFTGQNQDTESSTVPGGAGGLYDFLYRGHSPVQGRWLSPDPAGLAAVNPGDPQTWNRYAYVGNRPLFNRDALGLFNDKCNPYVDIVDCGGGGGGGDCLPGDPSCCDPNDPTCGDPGGGGGGGGHGGGGGGGGNPPPSNPPQRTGGAWPGNETLGLPSGMNNSSLSSMDGLLGLLPGINCGGSPTNTGFIESTPSNNNCPTLLIVVPLVAATVASFQEGGTGPNVSCVCTLSGQVDNMPGLGKIPTLCGYRCKCTGDTRSIRGMLDPLKDISKRCGQFFRKCPSIIEADFPLNSSIALLDKFTACHQ